MGVMPDTSLGEDFDRHVSRVTLAMPTTTRTIRAFFSSAFSDLKAERNALQVRVFLRLKRYCQLFRQ